MNEGRYLIEELCTMTGFSRRTVRYYVQEGLVDPPAGRGRGGYYADRHVAQLARIRDLQERGYRLDAIRGLLGRQVHVEAAVETPPAAPRLPPASSWIRHEVSPGVELHVSAETQRKLGPVVTSALEAVRSIVEREGGLNE
jgi:DNA-binding transcriptional MerR regulator